MCDHEAFQWVEVTSHMAPKTGDNFLPKHRQPTEIGRKGMAVCNRNNSLLIPLCFFVIVTLLTPGNPLEGLNDGHSISDFTMAMKLLL